MPAPTNARPHGSFLASEAGELAGVSGTTIGQWARRGLLMLVGQRRRLLNYMQRSNLEGYRELIKELGLRR